MTPEVKKRIEQIRQGIVPEGYVKDKDGIYPRDWASKKIGQWLKLAERSIVLQDEEEYQLVTIRRGFGGVDSRGSFLGKNVLVKNYFIVKTGDFIISKRQIAHGACGIVPPELDSAVVSNEYNVFLPQDGTNIQMFNLMMQLPHYKRLFYLMSDGVHIEKLLFKTQDWMKRTLAMPLLKEQKKIAEILSTQDRAIELQGRKIEELKRFKQGCLERMFPRKGQKVPEKRFPGFTDDWEQRKLTEFVEFFSGLTYTPNDVQENGTLVLRSSNVSNGEVVDADNVYVNPQVVNSENVKVGDIVVVVRNGSRSLIGKHAQIKAFMPNTVIGAFMTGIRSECPKFTNALLNTSRFEEEIAMNMGATINQITGYMFSKMEFKVPCLDEQKEIGEYFENLDHLITLHQRKLEEMKKQKKALMQLLLTGIVRVQGNRFCCDFRDDEERNAQNAVKGGESYGNESP